MTRALFRYSPRDALLLLGALLQAGLCAGSLGLAWHLPPSLPSLIFPALLFAATVWWSANTVAHNHLHRPLFRARALNVALTWLLTLATGVPQRTWRRRHLWHHAGERGTAPRPSVADLVEIAAVGGLWLLLLWTMPRVFLGVYLPGYLLAMLLCQLQGHYEHAGQPVSVEPGVSYYGRLYNWLWWNDGYHGEHHRHPGAHWTHLPSHRVATAATESRLPPVLRGLESLASRLTRVVNSGLGWALVRLERLALQEGPIQRYMLSSHRRALRLLFAEAELAEILRRPAPRIGIVGGGLFPRSALILAELVPQARLVLIEADPEHLALAQARLATAGVRDDRLLAYAEIYDPARHRHVDLLIFPLGYVGDRRALYQPTAGQPPRIVHEWLTHRPARAHRRVRVSLWLCKQLCWVRPPATSAEAGERSPHPTTEEAA